VGTWYGTTSYGPRIVITIARDGTVTSQIEGNTAYGVYRRGDVADFDTVRVSISRSGNGIESYNAASGERVVYSRRGFDDGPAYGNSGYGNSGYGNSDYGNSGYGNSDADGLGQRGIIVFENRNSTGNSQSFGTGRYLSGSGQFGQLRNDRASSIEVLPGYRARLCENEGDGGGGGQCEEFGPGSHNLRNNDQTSYIEVTRNGRFRGGYGRGNGNGYPNGYPVGNSNGYPIGNPNNYPAPGYPGGRNAVYVNDLAGQRISDADRRMRDRGFLNVDSYRARGGSFAIWWRAQSRQCIEVGLNRGTYSTITDIGSHPRCQ
jgi:hypothetical protein